MYSVYMLLCSDGLIYAGMTRNIDWRLQQHQNGVHSFTSKRLPVTLIWSVEVGDKYEAHQIERYIMRLSHRDKMNLSKGGPLITKRVRSKIAKVLKGETLATYWRA